MIRTSAGVCLLGILLSTGCAGDDGRSLSEGAAVTMQPIVDGVVATDYPEAAYLDIDPSDTMMYVCSGALISPSVVLTAGHCVDGHELWQVHVAGAYRSATRSAIYDWRENGASGVNPEHHDIGLVFLDEPVQLTRFPTLSRSEVEDNTEVTCVGRVKDGVISSTLYQRNTLVSSGDAVGYPYDYASAAVIQSGDSGGPVFLEGTHEVIAVNSGVGGDVQVLARVDLLSGWLALQLAAEDSRTRLSSPSQPAIGGGQPANGKSEAQSSVGATSNDALEDDGAESNYDAWTPHASLCSSVEVEANDTLDDAEPLSGATCGTLASEGDSDWFTVDLAPGGYRAILATTADAGLRIGRKTSDGCAFAYEGVDLVDITVEGGTATICMQISSAQRLTQSYLLSVALWDT